MWVTWKPISSMWPTTASVGAPAPAPHARERGAERCRRPPRRTRPPPRARRAPPAPRGRTGRRRASRRESRSGIATACGLKQQRLSWAAMTLLPAADAGGRGARAGREPAPEPPAQPDRARDSPFTRSTGDPQGSFFVRCRPMTTTPRCSPPTSSPRSRPTCACAREGAAALPARVGRAGPARPLLARRLRLAPALLRGGRGAAASRSSATSATTSSRRLEPTVPLPARGPELPESRFVVADTLVRFDHARERRRGARAAPRRDRRRCSRRRARRRRRPSRVGARRPAASPTGPATSAACAPARSAIRRGDAFQIVLSQRAERRTRGLRARALPRAAPRQPLALPLPARARRRRARRLLARDARQVRRRRAPR